MSETQFKTQAEATSTAKLEVEYWLNELKLADKREQTWREEGEKATSVYESEKQKQYQFNILFSNTETLSPVLYSLPPRPIVKRRYLDRDVVGAAGAKTIQRLLEFQSDTNEEEYDSFDSLMQQSLLHALVPGRGVTWWKFDAEVTEAAEATEGLAQSANGEKVVGEIVEWSSFRHGYAKSWNRVPWIARMHVMTYDELEANFGSAVAAKVKLSEVERFDNASSNESSNEGSLKTTIVWEVWDKTEEQVLFVSPGLQEQALKKTADPHGLEGFFPIARPLQFLRRVKRLEPICPYSTYREQAEELNRITTRINKIISALKVRGFYDTQIEGLELLLEQEDNKLIPADNVAVLQQGRKLDDAIWLMPIEKLVTVLQQLYMQREQVKQVIYEIMGIADIMRGASQASETATAQNLKSQWGGMRIKRWQRVMSTFVRDNLRVLAAMSAKHLPIPVLAQMTGLSFVMPEEKQQAMIAAQQLQAALAQMIAAQQLGQPVDPQQAQQLQAQLQQAHQMAAAIDWGQIKVLISNETLRNFRVDIETNSTLDAEATEDKQSISELMMAISQYFQSVGPLIQGGVFPFEMAKQMLLTIVRRFKFGGEVEEQLESMTQPPPPPQGGEEVQKVLDAQQALKEDQMKFEDMKQKALQELNEKRRELEDLRREIDAVMKRAEDEAQFAQKEQQLEQQHAQRTHTQEIEQMLANHKMQVQESITGAVTKIKQEGMRQKSQQPQAPSADPQQQQALSAATKEVVAAIQELVSVMSRPRQLSRSPDGSLRANVVVDND